MGEKEDLFDIWWQQEGWRYMSSSHDKTLKELCRGVWDAGQEWLLEGVRAELFAKLDEAMKEFKAGNRE